MSTNCENCKRLEKRLAELEQRCMELEKRNQELELLVRELLSRLNSNSTNSHKPPSSDPPKSSSGGFPSRARSKGRKHRPGVSRQMLPPEKVTQFITLQPETCCRSGNLNIKMRKLHKILERNPQELIEQINCWCASALYDPANESSTQELAA